MPSLLLLTGPSAGRRFELREETVIGRAPSCDLPLEDPKVSRRHAVVFLRDGVFHVRDLGSRNGTVVKGHRIDSDVALSTGDQFQIGATTLLFDPPARVAVREDGPALASSHAVEALVPTRGAAGVLYALATRLISATSEARILGRVAETVAATFAGRAAAMLGRAEAVSSSVVVGTDRLEVPHALAARAIDGNEVAVGDGVTCAPLGPTGTRPVGCVAVAREAALTGDERALLAAIGRLGGEAVVSMRVRGGEPVADVALVGTANAFRQALEQTRRLGVADAPMVFVGPPGTGKRVLARHVHALSARAAGPFVLVDCRQARDELRSGGAVLRADGGTLVLAHVEALPPEVAGSLAGWIRGRCAPGPEGAEEPVDLRVLATSARPLAMLRREGMTAELTELFAAGEVHVPALAERSPDVPALFEHFAHQSARRRLQLPPTLSPEARRRMTEYPWPGNLEELRLVAERLALLYPDQEIPSVRLPPEIQQGSVAAPASLDTMLAKVEREAVAEALRAAGGKKVRAAELLGISRPTLDKKIADYGLTVDRERGPARRTP